MGGFRPQPFPMFLTALMKMIQFVDTQAYGAFEQAKLEFHAA